MPQLLKDLITIPERVHQGDFVLKLSEGVSHAEQTLRDYVVTPQLADAFNNAMGFIEHKVERQIRVFDGVLDDVPDCEGASIRHRKALILAFACIVAAHKQAVLAQLLRVEEINLPRFKAVPIKGVFNRHKVRNGQLVG